MQCSRIIIDVSNSAWEKTMAVSDLRHCGVDFDHVLDAVESPAGAPAGNFTCGTFFVVPELFW